MSTDRWMGKEDVVYIYTTEYYSAIKKNEIVPFAATWMDLEILILSEVSETEKAKYHMISLIWGIKNMTQMNLFTKQKQTHRLRKKPYGYRRGKVREKDKLGVWDWPIYTTIFKIGNQQGPTL